MTEQGRVYFLSRPRRFGKSLLISTLEELFNGNKKLFEGLFIYDKWNWDIKYPVIRLDFGQRSYNTAEDLRISLTDFVNAKAKEFDIVLDTTGLSDRFGELIEKLNAKTGQRVVMLIDEYDKAMTDFMSDPAKASANRTELHNFYQVLKAADKHLQFIFLTGVSKFSGVSVFSALNNPNDLTLDKRYSASCGYTHEELETNFADYINGTADALGKTKTELLDSIQTWYNGYTWDGITKVYNPFSTLMLFDKQEFSNYWIKTGASISTEMLLEDNDLLETLFNEKNIVDYKFFDGFDLNKIKGKSFLFQTGYLTIKNINRIGDEREYFLEIPNKEVRASLMQYMLSAYSDIDEDNLSPIARDIKIQIKNLDAKGLEKNLRILFAKIPFKLYINREAYYHSIFLLIMIFLEFEIQGEVATNLGAIDALWKQPDINVVIEIKHSLQKTQKVLLKEAMNQIKEKKYYEPYMDKPVLLLAIAFTAGSNKNRLTEISCKFEKLPQ
jgi:hypothetical protein